MLGAGVQAHIKSHDGRHQRYSFTAISLLETPMSRVHKDGVRLRRFEIWQGNGQGRA
ncbi:MAG: hypothetical protein JWM11_4061, partial [Planctomycetaceae bacterium]|nr:hypothetical protein [Planctomycetaceae bacterium]